jgi:hypothetical protein
VSTSTRQQDHAVTIEDRREGRLIYITVTCTCGQLSHTLRGPYGLPGTRTTAEVISKAHLLRGASS